MSFLYDTPIDLVIAFVLAAVCFIAAGLGFVYRVKVGDEVQGWLEVSGEPPEFIHRPWSISATKGFDRHYVIRFKKSGVFFGVRRERRLLPFRRIS